MKQIIFCTLVICLLFSVVSAFSETGYDPQFFQSYNVYDLTPNDEEDELFIDTGKTFTAEQQSFIHKYEHDEYYSRIYSDIIVIRSGQENALPVARTWIKFYTTKTIYAADITFSIGDKKYTFTSVNPTKKTVNDNGKLCETLLIKYGKENTAFTAALYAVGQEIADHYGDPSYPLPTIPFVIHGQEDVEGVMSSASILDAWLMLSGSYATDVPNYFDQFEGSSLMVTGQGPTTNR